MPRPALAIAFAATVIACSGSPERAAAPRPLGIVEDARLRAADDEPQSWLTYGGSYAE